MCGDWHVPIGPPWKSHSSTPEHSSSLRQGAPTSSPPSSSSQPSGASATTRARTPAILRTRLDSTPHHSLADAPACCDIPTHATRPRAATSRRTRSAAATHRAAPRYSPRVLSSAAAPRVWATLLALAAVSGLIAGCLRALAPSIRRADHHGHLAPDDRRDACLACHDLESVMAAQMAAMAPEARAAHAEAMMAGDGGAPLVQDWMAEDPRECLACHRLREPRAARRRAATARLSGHVQ